MDTQDLRSFDTAASMQDPTHPLDMSAPQPHSRSASANSAATERPTEQQHGRASSPNPTPSIDSNFSSVQGKMAGTPPERNQPAEADDTVSSIWDDSEAGKEKSDAAVTRATVIDGKADD